SIWRRRQPRPTFFPYTTLFRSRLAVVEQEVRSGQTAHCHQPGQGWLALAAALPAVAERGPKADVHVALQAGGQGLARAAGGQQRSEEHTSELQSREKLVCRLLL